MRHNRASACQACGGTAAAPVKYNDINALVNLDTVRKKEKLRKVSNVIQAAQRSRSGRAIQSSPRRGQRGRI
ncbi:hypothetical protein PsYK624_038520 [Phanerochaete sordida]|uniref:Uncharacterized protein n=1 Tax=Phanerochaete sordida TaxID=48140 RepID=A0A9P3G596_9APHY|nr:hypothetical protein PsYK624_038520 [Phanerochaete sordida]